ncbi:hypothetical protein BGX31_003808 [Mortierella sp. GBA43]|nr:hypothetical protein BGX31_003808 [Mortierella sp. GBA43]
MAEMPIVQEVIVSEDDVDGVGELHGGSESSVETEVCIVEVIVGAGSVDDAGVVLAVETVPDNPIPSTKVEVSIEEAVIVVSSSITEVIIVPEVVVSEDSIDGVGELHGGSESSVETKVCVVSIEETVVVVSSPMSEVPIVQDVVVSEDDVDGVGELHGGSESSVEIEVCVVEVIVAAGSVDDTRAVLVIEIVPENPIPTEAEVSVEEAVVAVVMNGPVLVKDTEVYTEDPSVDAMLAPVEDAVVGAPDGLLLSSETGTDIGVATVMMLAVKDGVFTEASLEVSQYDGVVVMVIPVSDEVALKTLADEL